MDMDTRLPAIEAAGLGRDYGSTRALDALDLVIPSGAFIGLLGPNGAGKTTTMLLLGTLLKPSRGTARLFGHDVTTGRSDIRRRLGLVFQEASVDGLLTVQENLLFAARLAGLAGRTAHRAVAEVIERTGLSQRAAQPTRQLSTGWRRLTDFARALVHRPDLLILDEPTVGLDPEHRDRAWRLLEAERRERGTTILFSTHYLDEAQGCDRVVLLAHGRSVGNDTPASLKRTIGDEVIEIEGGSAAQVLSALRDVVNVRAVIKTEGGYRVGFVGRRDQLVTVSGLATELVRFTIRPVTLDDVYFARTQDGAAFQSEKALTGEPA
ncbi:MAG: ABC transporter ATP-binding protein [Blastocatellia bacterium]|nr:MAG: ABC transporter ATP-binding protein [Blastocatellia bacterium]